MPPLVIGSNPPLTRSVGLEGNSSSSVKCSVNYFKINDVFKMLAKSFKHILNWNYALLKKIFFILVKEMNGSS